MKRSSVPLIAGLCLALAPATGNAMPEKRPQAVTSHELAQKSKAPCSATVFRRYAGLMTQVAYRKGWLYYGGCRDMGFRRAHRHPRLGEMPAGFYVYSYPRFYIFTRRR